MPRPTRPLSRFAAAALLALFAGGCDHPLDPGEAAGTWALERVGDDALPATVHADDGVRVEVTADTLRLHPDGTGVRVTRSVTYPATGPDGTPYRAETLLDHRVRGERVEITYRCPPNAFCLQGPHATARPSGSRLTLLDGGTRLVYSRAELTIQGT